MSTVSKLFRSSSGYISPYFIVDVDGNLMSKTVTVTGNRIELTSGSYISYNGTPLLTATGLASSVVNIPGTLTGLSVTGPVTLNGSFSLTGGTSAIINPSTTGTLDNLIIGATSPQPGNFTTFSALGTASVDISPTGLVRINPTGPITITSTGTTSNIVLSASATGIQLGGGRSAISTNLTFSSGRYIVSTVNLPYHSYGKPGAPYPVLTIATVNTVLRAGTNVAGSATPVSPGIVGYALNGSRIISAATNDAPAGYTAPNSGWNYNGAYRAASSLSYNYNHDTAGGRVTDSNYSYCDFSFATAWLTGSGHGTGSIVTTGVAEVSYIPYLNGTLTHDDGHSKIIGFAIDGYPIYGPYGYSTAANRYSSVRRLVSGFTLNSIRSGFNAQPVNATYPLGIFVQDYTYTATGDLDQRNGRYCVTPDYPNGTYAYFMTIDAAGNPAYPYNVGTSFYGNIGTVGSGGGTGISAINNGTVTINPSGTLTLGTAGQVTNLVGNVSITNNQNITISPSSTGLITMNPATTGSINNITIGLTTAAAGRFTSVTSTAPDERFGINRDELVTKRYAENVGAALMYYLMR